MKPRRIGVALGGAFLAASTLSPAQVTERVSVDSSGTEGNDASEVECLSFDGRFVLFQSDATNLVASDTNGFTDIFVHDRLTGTTERVNVDSLGNEATGDRCAIDNITCISADGRFVSFYGWADNLAPGVDSNTTSTVFLHDRFTGITEVIDITCLGTSSFDANGGSMSADGRFVTFTSADSNLLPGSKLLYQQTFVRDRLTATTEIVSIDSSGNIADDSSGYFGQFISGDGRFVCFGSQASNLIPGVSGIHAYIHDRLTGITELVDVDPNGAPSDYGAGPGPMSADGRYVAFESSASNIVQPDTNGHATDVFVRDRLTGITEIVSVDSNGVQGSIGSECPTISADGRFVGFSSWSSNLVSDDTNGKQDVFIHDRLTGKTTRADLGPAGRQSDGALTFYAGSFPSISGDGRILSFTGWADDLVVGDTNGVRDVFVHGPYLTLEVDPPQVAAGATLTFTTWTGDASNLALLALMDIDGTPMFLPAAFSTFDASGVWALPATVPSGLSGHMLTLQTYGFVPMGKVQASNQVAVTFQ